MKESAWGLRKKYLLSNEYGSVVCLLVNIKTRNEKNCVEEVSSKSTLKWYKLAMNGEGWRIM